MAWPLHRRSPVPLPQRGRKDGSVARRSSE
ncbi:hypothetical protein [Caulobacter sp.]|nr:hypothetical protein [Caulobacter sp.]